MPPRAKRPCSQPGCAALVEHPNRYCAQHKRDRQRAQDAERGTAAQRGYDARWRKARLAYLKANPLCAQCLDDTQVTPATVVDHVIPHRGDQQLFWDEDNWQALCKSHHDAKTITELGDSGHTTPWVCMVCGPPGSGKSTYVNEHRLPHDLVVDVDAIYQALTGRAYYEKPPGMLPYVLAARDAVLNKLCKPGTIKRAWVIMGAPKRSEREAWQRKLNADLVMLTPSIDVCVSRIDMSEQRKGLGAQWRPIVERWWRQYQDESL